MNIFAQMNCATDTAIREKEQQVSYVVHMTECKPHSTVASARVARFIRDTLKVKLVDNKEKALAVKCVDKLIIVNGPMAFCDFLEELSRLVAMAKKVIWVQQDYTIMPPSRTSKAESPFRKVFAQLTLRPTFWTTCENNVQESDDRYINWNQLTYDQQPFRVITKNSLLYYGAFREKRQPSFTRFFKDHDVPLTISTTKLRVKRFKEFGCVAKFVPAFDDVIKDSSHYMAALYIEDELSHKEFHSPANRFYEMLSAGVALFFDAESVPMLAKAGIMVPDQWLVKNSEDLYFKLMGTDLFEMREAQRNLWHKNYVGQLTERLKEIWKEKQNG